MLKVATVNGARPGGDVGDGLASLTSQATHRRMPYAAVLVAAAAILRVAVAAAAISDAELAVCAAVLHAEHPQSRHCATECALLTAMGSQTSKPDAAAAVAAAAAPAAAPASSTAPVAAHAPAPTPSSAPASASAPTPASAPEKATPLPPAILRNAHGETGEREARSEHGVRRRVRGSWRPSGQHGGASLRVRVVLDQRGRRSRDTPGVAHRAHRPRSRSVSHARAEVVRNDLKTLAAAAKDGDLAAFRAAWAAFKRFLAVHAAMEDGGVFTALDARFDNAATSAGLPGEHDEELADAAAVNAALESGDAAAVAAAYLERYEPHHQAHLKHEEAVMMPLIARIPGPEKARFIATEILPGGVRTGDFDHFVSHGTASLATHGSAEQPAAVAARVWAHALRSVTTAEQWEVYRPLVKAAMPAALYEAANAAADLDGPGLLPAAPAAAAAPEAVLAASSGHVVGSTGASASAGAGAVPTTA